MLDVLHLSGTSIIKPETAKRSVCPSAS